MGRQREERTPQLPTLIFRVTVSLERINETRKVSFYVALSGRMIEDDELQRMRKEAAMPYFKVLSQNFLNGAEEKHGKPHSGQLRIGPEISQLRTTTFGTYLQCMI